MEVSSYFVNVVPPIEKVMRSEIVNNLFLVVKGFLIGEFLRLDASVHLIYILPIMILSP